MAPAYLRERAHGEKTNESRKKTSRVVPFSLARPCAVAVAISRSQSAVLPVPPLPERFPFLGEKTSEYRRLFAKKEKITEQKRWPDRRNNVGVMV